MIIKYSKTKPNTGMLKDFDMEYDLLINDVAGGADNRLFTRDITEKK